METRADGAICEGAGRIWGIPRGVLGMVGSGGGFGCWLGKEERPTAAAAAAAAVGAGEVVAGGWVDCAVSAWDRDWGRWGRRTESCLRCLARGLSIAVSLEIPRSEKWSHKPKA